MTKTSIRRGTATEGQDLAARAAQNTIAANPLSSYLGCLAACGQRKVASAVAAVCVLDMSTTENTTVGLFTTPATVKAADATFVLANSGHLQSHVNPPGNPKAFFSTGKAGDMEPDAWSEHATRHEGSWWPHWRTWIGKHSGPKIAARAKLGSRKHPAGEAAPGVYVREP